VFNFEWAPGTRRDTTEARRLILLAERASQATVIRELDLGSAAITFTIVDELRNSDAITLEEERRIVISNAWVSKPATELSELLSHELAHVAIGRIPKFQRIPVWLREGVAEIAAGRVGCRPSRDLSALHSLGYGIRSALHDTSGPPTAIHYKVYGSFAAFVLKASRTRLRTLLTDISNDSADSGIRRATGRGLDLLERQWVVALATQASDAGCN
jgi:hypothetical protein